MSEAGAGKTSSRRIPTIALLVGVILFALSAKLLQGMARRSSFPFRERYGLNAILTFALFSAVTVAAASAAAVVGRKLNRVVCVLGATAAGTMASLLYHPVLGSLGGLFVGVIVAAGFARPAAVGAFWALAAATTGALIGFAAFALTNVSVDPIAVACVFVAVMVSVVVGEALVHFVSTQTTVPARVRRTFGVGLLLLLPFLFGIWIGLSIDTLWRARLIQGHANLVLTRMGSQWLWDGVFDASSFVMSPSAQEADLVRLRRFRNIMYFYAGDVKLSDAGLKHVGEFSNLRNLVIDKARITDDGLSNLRGLSRLSLMQLSNTAVTGEGLSHLPSSIAILGLDESPVTDDGLRQLQHMAALVWLGLNKTQVTDAGLEHLRPLPALQSLSLRGTRVSDHGLKTLGALPTLTGLDLSETQITDAGLEHLKSLGSLTSLSLAGTQVGDEGLCHLKAIPTLQHLDLEGTNVTDEAIQQLRQARPNLQLEAPNRR